MEKFEVILYQFPYRDLDCYESKHLFYDRAQRDYFVSKYNLTNENIMNVFCVDKGHPDGIELHVIYKSGIIKIINPINRRIITYLIARPQQIKRYYDKCRLKVNWDRSVLDLAKEHQLQGLNNI